jgi:tetratricopeptide (TPR) repeat protein
MEALITALAALQAGDAWTSSKDEATVLLENAESARATKQTERVVDYCTTALGLARGCLGDTRGQVLNALDGSHDKLVEVMESGDALEGALDVLVTEMQVLQLRAEAFMDKGQTKEARGDLEECEMVSTKLCDDAAIARCLRTRGMLCLMRKEVKEAASLLERAVERCREAEEPSEEAYALKLLIKLHSESAQMYDRVCELYHQLLEAHQSGDNTGAVSETLLDLGQFRLRRHLTDLEKGVELEFADLEMTDMDLGGAVSALEAAAEAGDDDGGAGDTDEVDEATGEACHEADGRRRAPAVLLAEALTAVGTLKMLLGDQEEATGALERASGIYRARGDADGESKCDELKKDVRRIMDKVDSTAVTPKT